MIDINKKYQTVEGKQVRILCTDRKGEYPVMGLFLDSHDDVEYCMSWTQDGKRYCDSTRSVNDLIEISPYQDWPIDKPVWVRAMRNGEIVWAPAHFAGVDQGGYPTVFPEGKTSHTYQGTRFGVNHNMIAKEKPQ